MARAIDNVPDATGPLFRRLWRDYLRKHTPYFTIASILMILEGSTLAVLAWMLEPLFDKVFLGRNESAVWWVGGAILGLFLFRATVTIVNRAILTRIARTTASEIQADLLGHILTLDGQFFQQNPPGALIERVQGDTAAVQGVWTTFVAGVARDVISVVALAAVAIAVDPVWTLAAAIGVPFLIIPARVIQRYVRRKALQVRAQAGRRATRLDEVFHGVVAIKLSGTEDYQARRFRKIIDAIVRAEVKQAASRATMPALIDVVTGIGFFIVLIIGGRQIIAGERTVGEFMSFFTAMALTFQPLRRLGDLAGTWVVAQTSLGRIYGLLDRPSAVRSEGDEMPNRDETEIVFDDVWLSYGDVPALVGLSFRARAGQTTAIVGPSGAGKSTVFNLITRLIDPERGRIRLGGVDTRLMKLDALRGMFSVVSQESALFDESIRENILMGRKEVPPEVLDQIVQAARVGEFVGALPAGLDSWAGPRGSALSGGQRQRVAIARALLRDAPILLLDEATSALDAASEAQISQALEALSKGRTTLIIAHRLATVRRADHIVVMDKGRVVEEGTHDELLAQDGLYAGLCRLQFTD